VVRRSRILAVIVASLLVSALAPGVTLAANPTMTPATVASGLTIPWDVAFAPTGQMFVTERPGRIRVYSSGNPGASLLATNRISWVRAVGESGVMGIAVDHLFKSNRLIYVCVSRKIGTGTWWNQVIRYKVASNWTLVFDRYVIPNGMRAHTIHNGCAVEIGPDYKLWVTMGDAGQSSHAQHPTRLNGKVLRVGRDGSVPTDNPIMPGASSRTFVYSMGHRNPQGIAFHPTSKRVYIAEHGPELADEINWVRAGRNYGWPCVVGYGTTYTGCGGSFTNPVWSSGGVTIATSGAVFVKGTNWEDFQNSLFITNLKQSDLRRWTIGSTGSPATYRSTHFNSTYGRLRGAVLGPGNRLYLTTSNGSNDRVIRVTPS
jgi:glucose/arabinose dehydrogenase